MGKRRRINDFFAQQQQENAKTPRPTSTTLTQQAPVLDFERIARTTAEKVIALFTPGLMRRIEEIIGRLDRIEERLGAIEQRLERLERTRQEARSPLAAGGRGAPARRRGRLAEKLVSYLDENRFLLGSEARQKLGLPVSRLEDLAEEAGAVVIDAGGDIAVMLPQHLEEFDALLAETRTPDPMEAAQKLGVYGRLFDRMRKAGLVYYDSALGGWKRL